MTRFLGYECRYTDTDTICDVEQMMANGQAGAHHLLSNEEVHHYVAGPTECLDPLVGDHLMNKEMGQAKYGPWLA